MSVNKVIIIGNLGADPEVRNAGGQPVANLRVATNEVWSDKDGNRQERTEWHSVTVWGKSAELCGQYLAKGRQVYVEGRLQSRTYNDKDGIERRTWDVVASVVQFLGGGDAGGQRPAQGQARGGQRPAQGGGGGQRPAPASGGWGGDGGGGGGEWGGPAKGNGWWGASDGDDPIPF
jgi:single-strand DNA-binding protein